MNKSTVFGVVSQIDIGYHIVFLTDDEAKAREKVKELNGSLSRECLGNDSQWHSYERAQRFRMETFELNKDL